VDLVLDEQAPAAGGASDQEVDAVSFAIDLNVAEVHELDLGRRQRDAGRPVLEKQPGEEAPQDDCPEAVRLARVKQPGENIGMSYLGALDAEHLEEVELSQPRAELLELIILDEESIQGRL
jgi:hypothetical protein